MSSETLGIIIMFSSLVWMVGFMFGEEVAIICVSIAILQCSIGYFVAMKRLWKAFEEYMEKEMDYIEGLSKKSEVEQK